MKNAPNSKANICRRLFAYRKTRQPPIPLLGYIIGGIGFGLGGTLWRMGKRSA